MAWLAFALITGFLVVVFPVRSLLRRVRDGGGSGIDLAARRPRGWLIADALFVTAMTLLVSGTALEALGVLDASLGAPGAAHALGVALAVAAIGLAIWAQETMGAAWRPAIAPAAGAQLVTSGPFALVRNPNYVAMLAAACGATLLATDPLTLTGCALLLASLLLTARAEEPLLAARYGAPYRAYAARVGRFVPGVGRLA